MNRFKILYVYIIALFSTICLLSSCDKADPPFEHKANTIGYLICCDSHGGLEYSGEIEEYNAKGQLLTAGYNQAEADGGWGIITFRVPEGKIDLSRVYLKATLVYDEIVTPSFAGRHNILVTEENPDGKQFVVKSGTGTRRKYYIRGYYE